MFQIIRVGSRYGLVVAMTPAKVPVDNPEVVFYRLADWDIGECKKNEFCQIDRKEALSYFSGRADMGIGFERIPEDPFPTLDALTAFCKTKQEELAKAYLAQHPDLVGKTDEEIDLILRETSARVLELMNRKKPATT